MSSKFTDIYNPLVEYTNINDKGYNLLKINGIECFELANNIYNKKGKSPDKFIGLLCVNKLRIITRHKHLLNFI